MKTSSLWIYGENAYDIPPFLYNGWHYIFILSITGTLNINLTNLLQLTSIFIIQLYLFVNLLGKMWGLYKILRSRGLEKTQVSFWSVEGRDGLKTAKLASVSFITIQYRPNRWKLVLKLSETISKVQSSCSYSFLPWLVISSLFISSSTAPRS